MAGSVDPDWRAPLERHRARRSQGIPTVTVFVGDPEAAQWIWERWQRAAGRPAAPAYACELGDLIEAWLGSPAVRSDLESLVLQSIAARRSITVDELRGRVSGQTQRQLQDLVSLSSAELGCPPPILWSALGLGDGEPWSSAILQGFPYSMTLFGRLLDSRLPALLVREPLRGDARWPVAAARSVLEIAEAAPVADLGLAFSERDRERFEIEASDRDRALLREGEIRLRALPPIESRSQADHELVIQYDPAAVARSRAERELFRQLEARPRTRGLFSLNKTLAECFGGAPLEIDLFCERLRLAIEVDGYHHFRDPVAYRRDRRKDLLLQELDCVVVRVLASDVADELDYVLDMIDRAVERRMENTR